VIAEGDEPFTQAMRLNFDNAKRLYRHKLLPLLEQEHGVTAPDVRAGQVEATRAQRFRTDDRLIKTLILSGLADGVEALHALTPSRLAALNHGTVRSPIPGQESQIVLHKCRNWAAQVGEIKISDDGPNPVISFHLAGVDTEGILANALSADNYGNRVRKAEGLFFEQLGIPPQDSGLWPLQHETLWRGTWRPYELLFRNVRELPLESLKAQEGLWRVVIDFPFDRDGHTPMDDRAQLLKFQETGESSNCLVWLPAFFTHRTMDDLGRLVILDYVLSGNNLNQCGSHLSQLEREQARVLLQNQRDQMRQRLRNAMLAAYGVSTLYTEALDTSHDLGGYVYSLNPAFTPQPPVGAGLKDALQHLLAQALAHQFPAHPHFEEEVRRAALRRVLDVVRRATQVRDGRVEVERSHREEVRRIVVPLHLGDMGETHFVLRDEWKSRFLRKQAEEGHPVLTVRRLHAWMEQPEAMGLPRDIQNLVLLSVALQGNLTFYLNGIPVQPQLEQLDDTLELRAQALPDDTLWQEATQRAATILDIPVPALLHATSVAQFVTAAQQRAEQCRPDLDRLYQGLRARLEALGIEAHTAPRMQTVQATLTLVHRISEADKDEVVQEIASAVLATSATAMREAVKTVQEQAAILEDNLWELFERLHQLPAERAPRARAVVETVKDLLTRDEHVMPLVRGVKAAQLTGLDVLTEPAVSPAPATSQRPSPAPLPATALPEATASRRGIGLPAATAVFETITTALAANPALVLDLDWRLYTKDENAS
jgi:hypothetical protein